MSAFSELLTDIIKASDISIYSLAKEIDCGRSWLQRVIAGERHMDFDKFILLHKRLINYVDSTRLTNLYESFAFDYFGEKNYSIVMYIKNRLCETKELEDYIKKSKEKFSIDEYLSSIDIRKCEIEITKKAFDIISEELSGANKNEIAPTLYINIPSNWKYLKNLILIILNINHVKECKDFKYISNSRFENNIEKAQLENFLTSSEFASYGYNTYEGDANPGYQLVSNTIFPYFIITSRKSIMISDDGNIFMENSDEDILGKICDRLDVIISERKSFLSVVTPDTYSSVVMDRNINETDEFFDISNGISVMRFYTKEILQKIIPNDYSERDFMIETLSMFCEKSRVATASAYFTIESVRHFMETDESKSEGGYFNLHFNNEIKLQLLKDIYHYYSNSEGEIHMLKSGKYLAGDGIYIFGWAEKVICAGNYVYNRGVPIDAMAVVSSPVLSKHMKNYNLYMMNSEVCLDKENSLKVLENLIRSYEEVRTSLYNPMMSLDFRNSFSVLSKFFSEHNKTRD